jgi:signal-transduction protein with cAMP-binding, CBS, and nucleotidyltransferase domain
MSQAAPNQAEKIQGGSKIVCPDCGHDNLPGVDTCEHCHQSLTALSKPKANTAIEKAIFRDTIDVLSPREHPRVSPDMPVGRVLELLVEKRVGCALVVEDDKLVGIFSERDALMRLNTQAALLADLPIRQFMTVSPAALDLSTKIAFALHKMALGGYRHVPITADGRLVGVISIRDILSYITDRLAV